MTGVICPKCQDGYDPTLGPCPRCTIDVPPFLLAAPRAEGLAQLGARGDDELPPCPVCGNDVPCDVYTLSTEHGTYEAAECGVCHSIIPIDALKKWNEQRRQPVDARLKRAAELLDQAAGGNAEARTILRELLAR